MAPAMLGADGPRTYLMLFTTPSESRGLGGFVGSYAELQIADGQLTLGEFDRAQDLDAQIQAAGATVRDHDEFLRTTAASATTTTARAPGWSATRRCATWP